MGHILNLKLFEAEQVEEPSKRSPKVKQIRNTTLVESDINEMEKKKKKSQRENIYLRIRTYLYIFTISCLYSLQFSKISKQSHKLN